MGPASGFGSGGRIYPALRGVIEARVKRDDAAVSGVIRAAIRRYLKVA